MELIFKSIKIINLAEKKATVQNFKKGLNVVTSDYNDGNDRGKSLILKHIYYALGADLKFHDSWKKNKKMVILNFAINEKNFTIVRIYEKIFKIFNSEKKLIFISENRTELANFLNSQIWKFEIKLQNKEKEMIVAPPVFSYLISYIDQDGYSCSNFKSFENLGQFSDYRETLLFCHFGIHNTEYYELKEQETNLRKIEESKRQFHEMQKFVEKKYSTYAIDSELLEKYMQNEEEEYKKEIDNIVEIKNKIYKTQKEIANLNKINSVLESYINKNSKNINKIIDDQSCLYCKSHLTFETFINLLNLKFNNIEDVNFLYLENQSSLLKNQKTLNDLKNKYNDLTNKINNYNGITEINNKIKNEGVNLVLNDLINDINKFSNQINEQKKKIKEIKKELNSLKELEKTANAFFENKMKKLGNKFNLKLNYEKLKKVKNNFVETGSNIGIATIIWYVVLNEIKKELNPNSIFFPFVIDSPNNFEVDDNKKHNVIGFIDEISLNFHQLIFSHIGISENNFIQNKNVNIIYLDNDKNNLLNADIYKKYEEEINYFLTSWKITF